MTARLLWWWSAKGSSGKPWKKAALRAEKQVARELDVSPKDIDQAVRQAAGDVS